MALVALLGPAQDAGVPHLACKCKNCEAARLGPLGPQYAVSLALIDKEESKWWLLDCSPDIKYQYEIARSLAPDCKLQGVILTHLHMGHYTGLFHFGKEGINVQGLEVFATEETCKFFRTNQPWVQFLKKGNFVLREIEPDKPVQLSARITVTATDVPHRDEYSDTVAYTVQGPSKTLFYCPDIDSWDAWVTDIRTVVENTDINLLDACFYSYDELKSRNPKEIPHPIITDTAERVAGLESKVVLIHLNHTNPVYQETPERMWCEERGFTVGQQGLTWAL